jgi:Glycosyltransferase family 87
MPRSRIKFLALIYLSGMLAIHGASFWQSRSLIAKGYPDFTTYYAIGTMVRRGLGHELYDTTLQYKIQQEVAPAVAIRKNALIYLHPPFEAPLFVPFTYLSYLGAFIAWDAVNLSALLVVAFLFSKNAPNFDKHFWPLWLLASLAFFPIFLTLLQGQDSIVLLLLFTLAYICLKKRRETLAGGLLAVGLFRPQLILPFLVLWMFRRGSKILLGFVPIAGLLALLSLPVVGAAGLWSYPKYVLHSDRTLAQGALWPSDMPNLRGLIYILASHSQIIWVVLILSLVILLIVGWRLRESRDEEDSFDWDFSLALLSGTVLSYYCLGHDLSIVFLPMAIIADKLCFGEEIRSPARTFVSCALLLLFFSPLQLFLIGHHQLGVMGLAVLLLISGILVQTWPGATPRNSTPALSPLRQVRPPIRD